MLDGPTHVYQVGAAIFISESGQYIAMSLGKDCCECADVFSQGRIQSLPAHSVFDYKMDLLPDPTPPSGPLYPCPISKLQVMKTWQDSNSKEGKIWMSISPAAARPSRQSPNQTDRYVPRQSTAPLPKSQSWTPIHYPECMTPGIDLEGQTNSPSGISRTDSTSYE